MQSVLLGLHSVTGLPWWGTIALVTVGTRLVTAPLTLMQIRNTYRMTQARPEMEKIAAYMKSEGATNPAASSAAQERMAQVWAKYDCNPMKSLVGTLGQASVFMTFFFALKALAAAKVPSMVIGGTLWFTDLTSPDPYYGLPILTGAFMLAMVQLNAAEGMQGQSPAMVRNFKIGMSVLAVAIIPFSYLLPKSVFIYWITSNAMVALQNTALRIPAVKQYFKIPELKRADTQASFNAAASVVKTYQRSLASLGRTVASTAGPSSKSFALTPLPEGLHTQRWRLLTRYSSSPQGRHDRPKLMPLLPSSSLLPMIASVSQTWMKSLQPSAGVQDLQAGSQGHQAKLPAPRQHQQVPLMHLQALHLLSMTALSPQHSLSPDTASPQGD
ncbi:hypothetical protein WJX84_012222 [Apatococcus fuscideae]|uniref:Membrane insertase YidC/Oxa/ALB C-terminal domain-containing protein n=1 Tax=Apatococcus fuscideae TaxID=2026836 RepID=A0AAW1S9N5_9CHLO